MRKEGGRNGKSLREEGKKEGMGGRKEMRSRQEGGYTLHYGIKSQDYGRVR
jgi:hypothetical protein